MFSLVSLASEFLPLRLRQLQLTTRSMPTPMLSAVLIHRLIPMEGDAAFPIAHQGLEEDGEMSRYGINATIGVESAGNNDFIWSPTSTTSAGSADTAYLSRNDWTNGYGIPGLPGTNMDAVTLSHQ